MNQNVMKKSWLGELRLPANLDAERFVLGSILLDETFIVQANATLTTDDFSLEKHRRIWRRMMDLHVRGERIDRVALAEELMRHNELEACDGLSYLVSLDEGLPQIINIEGYMRIVTDKALLRRMIHSAVEIVDRAALAEDDPEDLLRSIHSGFLGMTPRSTSGLVSPGDIIRQYPGGLEAWLNPWEHSRGLRTGFAGFDQKTGGLHGGELIILAARPAMGKTALALNIAQHVAMKLGGVVAVFSLEMSKESLLVRLQCATARVDSQKYRLGFLNADEKLRLRVAIEELDNAPLLIDDTAATSVAEIHTKLRRLRAEMSLDLVVIDYLQLMAQQDAENRTQEVSAISRDLKLMAKELNVPVIVLSQLSRAPEVRPGDHRPVLSDLRDSGSIEQDADLVAFIFREEVYKPDREDLRGLAELIVAKQRNGPTGKVKLTFLHSLTKFENAAGELE